MGEISNREGESPVDQRAAYQNEDRIPDQNDGKG
jgi:hypothetical protein